MVGGLPPAMGLRPGLHWWSWWTLPMKTRRRTAVPWLLRSHLVRAVGTVGAIDWCWFLQASLVRILEMMVIFHHFTHWICEALCRLILVSGVADGVPHGTPRNVHDWMMMNRTLDDTVPHIYIHVYTSPFQELPVCTFYGYLLYRVNPILWIIIFPHFSAPGHVWMDKVDGTGITWHHLSPSTHGHGTPQIYSLEILKHWSMMIYIYIYIITYIIWQITYIIYIYVQGTASLLLFLYICIYIIIYIYAWLYIYMYICMYTRC